VLEWRRDPGPPRVPEHHLTRGQAVWLDGEGGADRPKARAPARPAIQCPDHPTAAGDKRRAERDHPPAGGMPHPPEMEAETNGGDERDRQDRGRDGEPRRRRPRPGWAAWENAVIPTRSGGTQTPASTAPVQRRANASGRGRGSVTPATPPRDDGVDRGFSEAKSHGGNSTEEAEQAPALLAQGADHHGGLPPGVRRRRAKPPRRCPPARGWRRGCPRAAPAGDGRRDAHAPPASRSGGGRAPTTSCRPLRSRLRIEDLLTPVAQGASRRTSHPWTYQQEGTSTSHSPSHPTNPAKSR